MTAYWLAQGVGVIAFLIGITTFFNRDERRFKKQLSVYSAVIGVHFFLLGTYPAGASAILNAIRTLITLRTRSLWVMYSAAIFLIPICISFDTAEKRRYATYLILNRRFSFEF